VTTVASPYDDVDPELLALPDPPSAERRLTLAALFGTSLACFALVAALRHDLSYALSGSEPQELGDLRTATNMVGERLVAGHAMLGAAGAMVFERPGHAVTYRLLPVAGRSDVWVEVRVSPGRENDRWQPPRRVVGRLVRFDQAGPRHRGLAAAIAETTGRPVPSNGWLVIDEETPERVRWTVALAGVFSLFALGCLASAVRLLAPLRKHKVNLPSTKAQKAWSAVEN
jgi:hypothetical protein